MNMRSIIGNLHIEELDNELRETLERWLLFLNDEQALIKEYDQAKEEGNGEKESIIAVDLSRIHSDLVEAIVRVFAGKNKIDINIKMNFLMALNKNGHELEKRNIPFTSYNELADLIVGKVSDQYDDEKGSLSTSDTSLEELLENNLQDLEYKYAQESIFNRQNIISIRSDINDLRKDLANSIDYISSSVANNIEHRLILLTNQNENRNAMLTNMQRKINVRSAEANQNIDKILDAEKKYIESKKNDDSPFSRARAIKYDKVIQQIERLKAVNVDECIALIDKELNDTTSILHQHHKLSRKRSNQETSPIQGLRRLHQAVLALKDARTLTSPQRFYFDYVKKVLEQNEKGNNVIAYLQTVDGKRPFDTRKLIIKDDAMQKRMDDDGKAMKKLVKDHFKGLFPLPSDETKRIKALQPFVDHFKELGNRVRIDLVNGMMDERLDPDKPSDLEIKELALIATQNYLFNVLARLGDESYHPFFKMLVLSYHNPNLVTGFDREFASELKQGFSYKELSDEPNLPLYKDMVENDYYERQFAEMLTNISESRIDTVRQFAGNEILRDEVGRILNIPRKGTTISDKGGKDKEKREKEKKPRSESQLISNSIMHSNKQREAEEKMHTVSLIKKAWDDIEQQASVMHEQEKVKDSGAKSVKWRDDIKADKGKDKYAEGEEEQQQLEKMSADIAAEQIELERLAAEREVAVAEAKFSAKVRRKTESIVNDLFDEAYPLVPARSMTASAILPPPKEPLPPTPSVVIPVKDVELPVIEAPPIQAEATAPVNQSTDEQEEKTPGRLKRALTEIVKIAKKGKVSLPKKSGSFINHHEYALSNHRSKRSTKQDEEIKAPKLVKIKKSKEEKEKRLNFNIPLLQKKENKPKDKIKDEWEMNAALLGRKMKTKKHKAENNDEWDMNAALLGRKGKKGK
jgi:hypothetical protein